MSILFEKFLAFVGMDVLFVTSGTLKVLSEHSLRISISSFQWAFCFYKCRN